VSSDDVYEIRDVVFGFVKLDAQEREIINHPAFQTELKHNIFSLTSNLQYYANSKNLPSNNDSSIEV